MTLLKLCMLAILGLCAALILKEWKADLLPLLRIGLLLVFGMTALSLAAPLVRYLQTLLSGSGIQSSHATLLLKALGIAWLTQSCADICRECGETGAANGVEWTGRLEILLLSLPLIDEILTIARELLRFGGAL
ncbi:MAG: hypothetical protein IJX28_04940 [Clostridia bacterium]|nr:hypothetical protein [Clostridia bacterium]